MRTTNVYGFDRAAYNAGAEACKQGKSMRANPYYHGAYPYTNDGIARDSWNDGFRSVRDAKENHRV